MSGKQIISEPSLRRKLNSQNLRDIKQASYYFTSTEPELIRYDENDEKYALAFNIYGNRYLFSNTEGHLVINPTNAPTRKMTKKEFNNIKKEMTESTTTCNTERKREILNKIEKLDFSLGHANATFEVSTNINKPTRINFIAINLGNIRYVYNQSSNSILKVQLSKTPKTGYLSDGPEKEAIIQKIRTSKTLAKKIATISAKRI